jgi:uncharacterized protein involved in cysteine biosynthesis
MLSCAGVGIALGLVAPLRGALFVAKHRLWAPIVWPTTVAAALSAGAAGLLVRFASRHWAAALVDAGFLRGLLVLVVFLVVAALAFLVLQPLVAAPFTDHLTEQVERTLSGDVPRASLLRSTTQAVAHGALKSVCYLAALALTALLGVVTGAGGALGAALLVAFLAYDGFDYPLARRGVSFAGKWAFLVSHPGLALGYGATALAFQLVPLAFLVAPALSAAGATMAYVELDRRENHDARRPPSQAEPGAAGRLPRSA